MNILFVHNFYRLRGGEDNVVEDEVAILRQKGHIVVTYYRYSDEAASMSSAQLALDLIWSNRSYLDVKKILKAQKFDLLHVHNTFPLISPSIYYAASSALVPVVQTLHNFRLGCLQAMYLRNANVCTDCRGKPPWRGVVRKCYQASLAQSGALALNITFHRVIHTYNKKVSAYVALNKFCRDEFIKLGLPPEKIWIKPNFVPAPVSGQNINPGRHANSFLYVGRLSEEKGIHVLYQAAKNLPDTRFLVAGIGPLINAFNGLKNVELLGSLEGNEVLEYMRSCTALIVPSIWYENSPRTIIEAFSVGCPVIASNIGALPGIVRDGDFGLLFEVGSSDSLARSITYLSNNPLLRYSMSAAVIDEFKIRYSSEVVYEALMSLYSAIASRTDIDLGVR